MKIGISKIYTALFAIVIFLQLYLPSFKVNILVQLAVLVLFFLTEKVAIAPYFLKILLPLLFVLFLGFTGILIHKYEFINIIKDISYFIKPFLGIIIGYFYYKKINDFRIFIKTIVIIGFASAIIHFFILLFFSNFNSISGIREHARDNFLELFALFFLSFYYKHQDQKLFSNRLTEKLFFYLILASCVLYFSRTMLLIAIMLVFSFYGYTVITKKTIKIFACLIFLIVAFYFYLFTIKINRNAQGMEGFLYKIKIAPSELFETKIDRNNHKDLWDHWRGYESKRALALMNEHPTSYLFGMGYGSLINLKFKAPLSNDRKGLQYISNLHNGYSFILYKTGLIGLFLYIIFLLGLYKTIYKETGLCAVTISSIGIYFLITTTTITGIFNTKDAIVFILGAMIFFKSKNTGL